jgi:hypothetical protein
MIDKDMTRLSAGEIGLSVEDGKAIMAQSRTARRSWLISSRWSSNNNAKRTF